jgi:hypothetical protein
MFEGMNERISVGNLLSGRDRDVNRSVNIGEQIDEPSGSTNGEKPAGGMDDNG